MRKFISNFVYFLDHIIVQSILLDSLLCYYIIYYLLFIIILCDVMQYGFLLSEAEKSIHGRKGNKMC